MPKRDCLTATLYCAVVELAMLCPGRAANLMSTYLQAVKLPGVPVEMGTFRGYTAALLTSLGGSPMRVYDSFQGLVDVNSEVDGPVLVNGAMRSQAEVVAAFYQQHGLQLSGIVPKRFQDLTPADMPDTINFAHLDSDTYESTLLSLSLVYPRMGVGAIMVVDDYRWARTPGVALAVDSYCLHKPLRVEVLHTGNPNGLHCRITKC